ALQREQGVQRRPRVLEHETDAAAVHAAEQSRRGPDQLRRARQRTGAGGHSAGGIEQPGRGEHGHRFPRSGFADDAHRLLPLHVEADIAQDLAPADAHPQVANAQDGVGHCLLLASIMVRCLGSSTSRSPSPTRLNASTMTKIAAPGNTAIHYAIVTKPCESKIIRPSDGCGGWMPSPRNDSAASDKIANASDSDVCTISGPEIFGTIWRARIYASPVPMARDIWTNGSTRTLSVLARATRAKIGV